ncbi:MAG TPA: TIGR04053 family radical SAM/SPASM domain-containing protein [Bryobacteraceae bacterium]|nr:TIGR04053 family radical SAM/SPASM domain-containing protein [Bryobacteraceae bacterium]
MGTSHIHGHAAPRDFSMTPMNVYWEMTQSCALACRHCRAEAISTPHPDELGFEEGVKFLRQIPGFGDPLPQLILTGGDPLARTDLYELIDEARRLNIAVSITPAATPALTREVLVKLQQHGVDGLGLSLDGSTADRHDSIRGVPGTFDRTMSALGWAQELGMPVQVNTLVAAETADDMPAIFEVLKPFGLARWSLFFLISVGRGKVLQPLSPEEAEKLMGWIHQTSRQAAFTVSTTEAPSFRRVALEKMREAGMTGEQIRKSGATRSYGIRDGHGIMFVSNTGDICPAGFLPLPVGNVRKDNVVEMYRDSPLFRQLHDPTQFEDRCGVCDYRTLCGGSRSRAFSATGNPLASDPLCLFDPS